MTISLDPRDWKYFSQGAANVIFQFSNNSGLNTSTTNLEDPQLCLLRLRKKIKDLPTTVDNWSFIENSVIPLTNGYMASMKLVKIDTELLLALNDKAGQSSDNFPFFELNISESHGILMQNLRPPHLMAANKNKYLHISTFFSDFLRSAFIEFKPKWLVQSLSAPSNSRYCRTCAVKQMRGKSHQITYCPLQLLKKNAQDVKKLVDRLLGDTLDEIWHPIIGLCLHKVVMESPVFSIIKSIQEMCQKSIVDYSDTEDLDNEFGLFMSACDCTLLINIMTNNIQAERDVLTIKEGETTYFISCKLVDLDKKNIISPIKRKHWKSIEEKLINEGWYTGINSNSAHQLPSCF
ncbi:hypothetical protein NADFUDRAFT_51831 [Nadsonia fulvescens var. elongata DSM 6958]|uniref:Inositol-pentakisphosphate 2-kinase n=1 Tax=Nadsonia fulvescens var. elongata DSM 6958 TaxID=857566 RepID=A0A1E3PIG1_9ASCO|nr:hypothetical protein NADFUDRAFT_51831 [Nadsonia fulvescens var. elongata DSM 6958]